MERDGVAVDETERPDDDARRQDRRGWVWYAILAVLVILVLLLLVRLGGGLLGLPTGSAEKTSARTVTVPDVVGLTLAQAVPRLALVPLKLASDASPSVPPDAVIVLSQSPAPGASLPENGELRVTVRQPAIPPSSAQETSFTATGGSTAGPRQVRVPRYVTVPDVSGLTRSAAEAATRDAGLEPYVIPRPSTGGVRPGHAYDQMPAPGSRAIAGSELLITVGLPR